MLVAEAKTKLTVDLPAQQIIVEGGATFPFEVGEFRKHCLVNGLDDIGLTLQKRSLIDQFEVGRTARYPWLDGPTYSNDRRELRVATTKAMGFYTHMARGLLTGLPATGDLPAKPPAKEVVITATGAAVERAVRVALELQDSD